MAYTVSARVARRDSQAKHFGNQTTENKLETLRIFRVFYPELHDRITRMVPFVFTNRNPILPFLTQ